MSCSLEPLLLLRSVAAGALAVLGLSGDPPGAVAEYGPRCPAYLMEAYSGGTPNIAVGGSTAKTPGDELAAVACYGFDYPGEDTLGSRAEEEDLSTTSEESQTDATDQAPLSDNEYDDDSSPNDDAYHDEYEYKYEYGYEHAYGGYDAYGYESYDYDSEYAPYDEEFSNTEAEPNDEQAPAPGDSQAIESVDAYSNYYQYGDYQSQYEEDYEYAEPTEQYGNRPTTIDAAAVEHALSAPETVATSSAPAADISECLPSDLLTAEDLAFLQRLDRLTDETGTTRSAATQRYLENFGPKAWRFVGFFEGFTGTVLADATRDALEVSLLLGTIRLVERNDLPLDRAASILRAEIYCPSNPWSLDLWNTLQTPTAGALTTDDGQLLDAFKAWGKASLGRLENVIEQAAGLIPELRWDMISLIRLGERSAKAPSSEGVWL